MTIRDERVRIAMIHFGFFYSGGGEKLVLEEILGLRSLGHDVTCFAPYIDRSGCFPDSQEIQDVQALLPQLPRWIPLRHALSVVACCVLAPALAYRFRSYDVIFAANQPSLWIALVVGRLLRTPYVAYLAQPFRLLHPRDIDLNHGLSIDDKDQIFVRIISRIGRVLIDWADRRSVKGAASVLTNGDYATRWISQIYGRETLNCPAGCHPVTEIAGSAEIKWDGGVNVNSRRIRKPFILVTNRHAPHKRFEYALWALKALRRQLPHVSLVITGQESKYTSELRYLAESLRLEDAIQFVGLVSQQDLDRLYREAAVYVYPAPEEDFGMGMIEAMATGTPVVAWDQAGPTGIVEHGRTGFLVQPFDTDEFARRIGELVADRELNLKLGSRSLAIARSTFSYERHHRRISSVLLHSLAKEPRPVDEVASMRIRLGGNRLEPQRLQADDPEGSL